MQIYCHFVVLAAGLTVLSAGRVWAGPVPPVHSERSFLKGFWQTSRHLQPTLYRSGLFRLRAEQGGYGGQGVRTEPGGSLCAQQQKDPENVGVTNIGDGFDDCCNWTNGCGSPAGEMQHEPVTGSRCCVKSSSVVPRNTLRCGLRARSLTARMMFCKRCVDLVVTNRTTYRSYSKNRTAPDAGRIRESSARCSPRRVGSALVPCCFPARRRNHQPTHHYHPMMY